MRVKAAMARLGPEIAARIAYITPEEARLLPPNLVALAEARAILHSAAAMS